MSVFQMMHRGIDAIRDLPGIRHAREAAFERRFATDTGSVNYWRGVYASYDEALAAIPDRGREGYDNEASAVLYGTRFKPLLKDYPAMFWLQRAFDDGARSVFDLGGHVGMKYYAFEPNLALPPDWRWTVCDVPAVVRRGRDMAAGRGAPPALTFTDRWQDLDGHDTLFASGSLQYLRDTLGEMLARLAAKPRWLVINTTPLHPSRSFFTINGTGTAYCPYRIAREDEFTREVVAQGYEQLDRWETPKNFLVPFRPGYEMKHYVGMCLRRVDAG